MRKNSSETNIKKFNTRMQAKLLLVFCVIILLLMVLIGRLIYIMQTDGERYAKRVLSRQAYSNDILPYKRGSITDRNGTVLAQSELQYRLILDPKKLLENEASIPVTLNALQEHFGFEPEEIKQILQDRPKSQYYILLKNLKHDKVTEFKQVMKEQEEKEKKRKKEEKKNKDKKSSDNQESTVKISEEIIGIWFDEEYVRVYPFETLASDILGFTSVDNIGYYGIEEYYNEELNGVNGIEFGYYDSELNIDRIVKKPQHGNSVVSTIDANIQRIIQNHIRKFNEEIGSKNIGVLVMNPNNGEIIAMASNAEYDLNDPRNLENFFSEQQIADMTQEEKMDFLNKLWRNDVISSSFEPGSTFKPVTVANALEEALVSDHSTFDCDGGEMVGGFWIRCSNRNGGHGTLTLGEALMKSCNDSLMQIVSLEGRDLFYNYQTGMGFGSRTGLDLPGEARGIIVERNKLNSTELATSSFGQTFTVTMVQMAAAYSSLVNGGNYYQPHIMRKIVNERGATVRQFNDVPVKRMVSEETSKLMQKYMYQTVEQGTAKPAKVEGYAVGGKTGTAQKLPRDAKTYIVSFIGAVPAINPEVVIYVMIDEPTNVIRQDDSSIATKLTSQILAEILPALGIYPEGEIDYLLPEEPADPSGNPDITPPATSPEGTGNDGEAASPNEGNSQGEPANGGSGEETGNNGNSPDESDSGEGGNTSGAENPNGSNSGPGTGNDFDGEAIPPGIEGDFNPSEQEETDEIEDGEQDDEQEEEPPLDDNE